MSKESSESPIEMYYKKLLLKMLIIVSATFLLIFGFIALFEARYAEGTVNLSGFIAVSFGYAALLRNQKQSREAYEKLNETQSQLLQSSKLASIGQLAAGVAHELNQPLMVIRSNIQLMLRKLNTSQSKASNCLNDQESLEMIEKSTSRMIAIIKHLRMFSRQSDSAFKPVEINTIIDDVISMVYEQLRLRNISITKELTPNLPQICADANQLEQVFLNLITNAKDSIINSSNQTKEIKITTQLSDTIITSKSSKFEKTLPPNEWKYSTSKSALNYVEILFQDTGNGIEGDKIEKIFDPFFTTKKVGDGTGLGLSISYGIIQEHKGKIEINRTGPKGTIFKIQLPALGAIT